MNISINKLSYRLASSINWSSIRSFPEQIRTTGEQKREDYGVIPQWVPRVSEGVGRKFWRPNEERYWVGTALTLWPGQITLPLLVQASAAITGESGVTFQAFARHKGTLYAFFIASAGGAVRRSAWDGANWGASTLVVATINGAVATAVLSATVDRDTMMVAARNAAGDVDVLKTTDVTAWTAVPQTLKAPFYLEVDKIDNIIYAAGFDATNKKAQVYKSTDKGANWSLHGTGEAYTDVGPTGLVVVEDPFGSPNRIPFYSTPEGLYLVNDESPNNHLLAFGFPGVAHSSNGIGLAVWSNLIVVPIRDGGVFFYDPESGTVTPRGLDDGDGVPTDYLGTPSASFVYAHLLFLAIKGTTYSGIWAFNGNGWHNVWMSASSQNVQALAAAGVTVPALLFSPVAGTYNYLQNFHTNPLEVSAKYAASAWVDYPLYAGEITDILATFYQVKAEARELIPGAETLSVLMLFDDEPGLKRYGRIEKTTDAIHLGEAGISGHRAYLRMQLDRGSDNTKTPVLLNPVLYTSRDGQPLLTLSFELDVNTEELARLRSLQEGRLAVPVTWGDQTKTMRVKQISAVEGQTVERAHLQLEQVF